MSVSSRTPEGLPNECPVCGKPVSLEPSAPLGDAPCPHCGHLLWFVTAGGHLKLFDKLALPLEKRERLAEVLETIREIEDSMDAVELVMELEEEFHIGLSDQEADLFAEQVLEWIEGNRERRKRR
jgi:acyl carrier protein